jgi:hypothetical protein
MLERVLKDWRLWVILVAGLILWLSSCTKPETTLYICKAGQHDFKPSPVPFPFSAKTMTGWARLDSSCWYNDLGEDTQDWNKLAGVYRWYDVVKNKNSFILAWRPDPIRNVFQLCLYENIDGANRPHEQAIYKVNAGQGFKFWLQESNGKYALWINATYIDDQDNDKPFGTVGKISAWFGGNRTAPHDMSLQMDF